ncbi:hypothetical protein L227DRAFT_427163 [Lentinus tigrinus ALCF2SS1-6]|uniref:Uncharacterized protein n=1 Tax=Lentinus tigrinus ALCF2SS1-6 TaxID=1328759 RepID=A0A5C2RR31_9APHY|nr:hypothetical protein L227DRAFT_427163 [Lentinus tigrinus ALCF2SS1-6]
MLASRISARVLCSRPPVLICPFHTPRLKGAEAGTRPRPVFAALFDFNFIIPPRKFKLPTSVASCTSVSWFWRVHGRCPTRLLVSEPLGMCRPPYHSVSLSLHRAARLPSYHHDMAAASGVGGGSRSWLSCPFFADILVLLSLLPSCVAVAIRRSPHRVMVPSLRGSGDIDVKGSQIRVGEAIAPVSPSLWNSVRRVGSARDVGGLVV